MTQFASAPSRSTPFAEHSLVAYIAPLVEGRRVAVVGPSSADIARRARELGAQNVVALGGSGDGVAVRPLGPGAIEAFRSRLDCVIVPDAESVPLGKVLDETRRTLGRDGVVVVAIRADAQRRNERALDFHGLRAALEDRFSTVKMVGAGAFAGYAIASFDQAADDVTLDTRLMTDDPAAPELFIAIASEGRFSIDAMAIVQVPAEAAATPPVAEGPDPATLDALDRLERTERALEIALQDQRAAMDRADALTAELERARNEVTHARGEASQGRDQSRKLSQRADELTRALADAERAERELRAAIEQAERDRDLARRDLQKARGEGKDRERAVGEDIARLERALGEKGREAQTLRAQLADRDSAVRELLYQLDALRGSEGSQRMAALEARNAELGSLHAALGAEASRVAQQNDVLRERVARLESVIEAREAEARQLEFQLTQARAQGAAAAKVTHDERLVARHADELSRVRAEYEAKLSAARVELETVARRARAESDAEHALQQVEQAARAARARDEADEEAAKLRAELESNKRRALDAELALKNTLQRFTAIEAAESDARARAASAETRLADALRAASQQSGSAALLAPLHDELSASTARAAALESSLEDERERRAQAARLVEELRAQLSAAQESAQQASAQRAADEQRAAAAQQQLDATKAQLASALVAEEDLQDQLSNTRNELSRLLALNASIDERVSQLELELEGSRKGYTRRVRELEREVEQLVRALEVATSSAGEDGDAVTSVQRELDSVRAERAGVAFRLADAEAALDALSKASAAAAASESAPSEPPPALPKSDPPAAPDNRAEQLLATLAETAARLASTEETLTELTAQLEASQRKIGSLEAELDAARARASEATEARAKVAAAPAPSADVDALKRESSEKELLVRSLVAQLEDRDLRLRALERRLVEEVERARRTESEIWELELRARDQRIAAMQREIERAPSDASRASQPAPDAAAVRAELASKVSEAESALRSIERVRATISAILVDGRGAGVSHELVALLRELDEPSAES